MDELLLVLHFATPRLHSARSIVIILDELERTIAQWDVDLVRYFAREGRIDSERLRIVLGIAERRKPGLFLDSVRSGSADILLAMGGGVGFFVAREVWKVFDEAAKKSRFREMLVTTLSERIDEAARRTGLFKLLSRVSEKKQLVLEIKPPASSGEATPAKESHPEAQVSHAADRTVHRNDDELLRKAKAFLDEAVSHVHRDAP